MRLDALCVFAYGSYHHTNFWLCLVLYLFILHRNFLLFWHQTIQYVVTIYKSVLILKLGLQYLGHSYLKNIDQALAV